MGVRTSAAAWNPSILLSTRASMAPSLPITLTPSSTIWNASLLKVWSSQGNTWMTGQHDHLIYRVNYKLLFLDLRCLLVRFHHSSCRHLGKETTSSWGYDSFHWIISSILNWMAHSCWAIIIDVWRASCIILFFFNVPVIHEYSFQGETLCTTPKGRKTVASSMQRWS